MEFQNLIFEKKGSIGILSINRPKALNALNSQTLDELDLAVDMVQEDNDVHVLIVTGAGRAFVAGADIAEMKELNAIEGKAFGDKGMKVFRKLELLEKPVIAAVNGFALGGGCELCMSADIRIASEDALFGQPEVGLGITPGFSGTQRLPRIVGEGIAKELIFTARNIKAEEALRIGLVNRVVATEELMNEAIKMAEKIASNAQLAVRFSKEAINRGLQTDIDTAISIERDLFGLCFATEDQKEGMTAFLEKRRADYKLK